MKNLKKAVSVILVAAMALSLAGCASKFKAVDEKDFKEACKSAFGAKNSEIEDYGYGDVEFYAYEEKNIEVSLMIYDDEDDAQDFFEDVYDELEDAIDDGDVEGKTKLVNHETWGYVIVKGENEDGDDIYAGFYLVDDQIIMFTCESLKDKDVSKVNDFLKDLGLPRI